MRCALEPVALYHSVPNLTAEQIKQIEKIHKSCNAAETSEHWEEANRDFHMAVISACKMPRLIAEIGKLQLLYAWHFNARYSARWRRRDDPDHAAILEAIKDRDANRARTIMQRHLSRL
nr:FCD domain-containing protein [Ruegeria arenilitoris]